jgi:hypothetical protein
MKNSSVSFFAHNTEVFSPYKGNIIDILTSRKLIEKHGKRIEQLRACEYKSAEYNNLKNGIKGRVNSLPLITPHGTFTQRGSNYLIKHSGLLSFDIDCGGNSWLNKDSAPLLRDKLGAINSVCYCALSAGGQGVWGVVAIQHTDKHEQYYIQMERDFLQRFKIVIDKSCKDIPRARYWSHDKHAVIKATAEYYKPTFYTPPPAPPKPARQYTNNTIPESAAKYLIDNRSILECTYQFFLRVFFACRDAFGEAGKQTAIDILTACTTFAASNTAKNVDAVWRSTAGRPTGKAITAGTLVHIAQEAGYRVPAKQTKPAQQITTPSRHSFVMPAPNYGALDKAIPVLKLDEGVPVGPMDDAVPVSPMDEAVPVGPMDEAVKQALRSAGWIHHYTETEVEAEQDEWNNSPGVRWAKQIRQRGTSLNAVPYYERQTARQ